MNLQEKYNSLMDSQGIQMIEMLSRLTPTESKYINAKMILKSLEEKKSKENPQYDFETPESINKRISIWTELVQKLESSQHLAIG